ncbi:glycosyltransferase [Arcobacter porcinus]|uniref:Glycosyltransferase, family 1 n=1 Tax=Arcobacter porcinus TaxID=1935204 RepID=A0A5C2HF92_9BACT|nr:glycosyltransferase [Arcobacter porcinus]OCL83701.1 Glycosyl transferases group 1 [Arcobacter porcinus]OCL96665.1 Glycosyl transferases group 1 [Aliarcobacter thereius]QEP41085.1 glycosyltransferase, family 1 [Arcobacter porcinus]
MRNIVIHYKTINSLIEKIKENSWIKIYKKPILSKIFGNKDDNIDIYFHSGNIDDEAITYAKKSKHIITNSFSNLNEIIKKTDIEKDKIDVIYPSANIVYTKEKIVKEKYKKEFELSDNTKLILFSANNFKTSGIKEFLDIVSNISYIDFKVFILGSKQQLKNLEFSLPKYEKLKEKIVLLDNKNSNIDEIFSVSDIFLLPTHSKNIASSVIKAMYCKCVVFSTINNDIKELIDVFSTMDKPNDPSTPFKIDAILHDINELKNIKKQNRKIAKELELSRNILKFTEIIKKI